MHFVFPAVDVMQPFLPDSLLDSVMEIFPREDLRRGDLSSELFW